MTVVTTTGLRREPICVFALSVYDRGSRGSRGLSSSLAVYGGMLWRTWYSATRRFHQWSYSYIRRVSPTLYLVWILNSEPRGRLW